MKRLEKDKFKLPKHINAKSIVITPEKLVENPTTSEKLKKDIPFRRCICTIRNAGNAENFIKEEKYGYDLKNFPCLKLNANYAYGLLAMERIIFYDGLR